MHLYGFSKYLGEGLDEEIWAAYTPRQRVIMYLHFEEGYNQTEIEQILCYPKPNQSEISKEIARASRTSASIAYWNIPGLKQRLESLAYESNV